MAQPTSLAASWSGSLRWAAALFLVGSLVGAPTDGRAQDATPEEEAEFEGLETAPEPLDPLGRDSPRGTMLGFLKAARAAEFERAARYLDLRGGNRERGPELARRLKIVLDRNVWIDIEDLDPTWEGNAGDALGRLRDRVAVFDSEKLGRVSIVVARRPYESKRPVWKIAGETVRQIDELYAEYGYGPLDPILIRLPPVLTELQVPVIETRAWQLAAIIIFAVVSIAVAWIVMRVAVAFLSLFLSARGRKLDAEFRSAIGPPLQLLAAAGLFVWSSELLVLPKVPQRFINALGIGIVVIGVLWLTMRSIDQGRQLLDRRLARDGSARLRALLPLGAAIARISVIGLGIIVVLDTAGINVTGIIAGVGIGGLAFALAAQKTVENLIGGISVIADEPVRVGDFCRIGDVVGTVEQIGIRTTRIRTLGRTVLSIPNAEFSSSRIENFARRDRILILTTFGVRYETSPDQLRYIIAEVRRMLLSHPLTDPDPARVRFVGFGPSSLDLEVFCYVHTRDWSTFLAIQEDIFLRVMDIVRDAGSSFAFPSQTVYLGRDEKLPPEVVERVESQVAQWRTDGRLPIPDYAPDERTDFRGSIDYPEAGSALAASKDRP